MVLYAAVNRIFKEKQTVILCYAPQVHSINGGPPIYFSIKYTVRHTNVRNNYITIFRRCQVNFDIFEPFLNFYHKKTTIILYIRQKA